MMFASPITAVNELQAFRYVQKKTIVNQRCRVISAVILPIGCTLFVLMVLFAFLGACYSTQAIVTKSFFEAMPFFGAFWEPIETTFLSCSSYWFVNMLMWPLLVYVPPLAVSAVLSLVITLVYRPKPIELEIDGTPAKRAEELHRLASNIPKVPALENKDHLAAVWLSVMVLVLPGAVCALHNGFFIVSAHTPQEWMRDIGVFVGGVGGWLCVSYLLIRVFIWVNSIFYSRGWFNYLFLHDTKEYWLSLDPDEAA